MYVKLNALLPHLGVRTVWGIITDPEKLTTLLKIGLFYLDGHQVSIFKDGDTDSYWLAGLDKGGIVPKHFRLTDEVLANCFIREYRYHAFIGDPLKIDFVNYESNTQSDRIDNNGKDYADAVIGSLMMLTATAVMCHAAYKRFWK